MQVRLEWLAASTAKGKQALIELELCYIKPSPENNQLYRPVDSSDPEIVALAVGIMERGLLEPLVITIDGYILSGHRRYAACELAGLETVPCRLYPIRREDVVLSEPLINTIPAGLAIADMPVTGVPEVLPIWVGNFGKAHAVSGTWRRENHLRGLVQHGIGPFKRSTVGQLDHGNQVTFVLARNESGGHRTEPINCQGDQNPVNSQSNE